MMSRRKDKSSYKAPPSIHEQKRIRRKDLLTTNGNSNNSIVPSPPYLLTSKLLDYTCTSIPIINNLCPPLDNGGWRTLLANYGYEEIVTFPEGKLSHSFYSSLGSKGYNDVLSDVTYKEYMHMINTGNMVSSTNNKMFPGNGELSNTLNNYYNFAFNTNTTSLCDLTSPLALMVLFVLLLTIRSIKKVALPKFCNLGHNLATNAHGSEWTTQNSDRITKFGEYIYRLIFHTGLSIYGIYYFHDKSWWNKNQGGTINLWWGHPNHSVEPGMIWYYLIQCAYNVDALVSLIELSFTFEFVNPLSYSSALIFLEKEHVVDEEQRKSQVAKLMKKDNTNEVFLWTPLFQVKWSTTVRGDFREMIAHHLVTNALIFFSSYYRFTRVGSMVFLLHDLSDVPIDMSKLANFVKWKVTTIICFVIMVLMWIITRLTIFPFVICKAVWYESYEYMVVKGTLDPALYEAYYLLFYTLLGSLVLLHVTWFLILLRIGWTLVSTGERHDYSEHKSGEKQKES